MITPSLLVISGALVYIYRHYHQSHHPSKLHKLYGRVRVVLGFSIVALLTTIAYQMPTEFGRYFKRVAVAQNALARDRQSERSASEIRHTRQMIDAFGGVDNYLAYLKRDESSNSEKN
jgi:hypothetical protein